MQAIADWLEKLGMSEYAQRFAENRIDLSVLPDLTDQHLKDLGIALGDRLKMLRAIANLDNAPPAAAHASAPASVQPIAATIAVPAPESAGERRHVTVMFCDLVDSTGIAARLDAEEWRDLVSGYLDAASAAVTEMGGKVAKKLGDGLMALFGYPVAQENDAERAVRAAIAVQRALAELNRKNAGTCRPALAARIAIDSGPVVVDATGEILGEVPSIAARAQALAEPGAVVVTARVQRQVAGLFVAKEHGSLQLKGVWEPVTLYRLIRPSGGGRPMTDYYPLIVRAVEGLDRSTGEARRALYERARNALVAQLRSNQPPLLEADITKERLALEEAIRKVEAEATRKLRTETRTESRSATPPVGTPDGGTQVASGPPRRDRAKPPPADPPGAGLPSARERLLSGRSSLKRKAVKGSRDVAGEVRDLGAVTDKAARAARQTREAYEPKAPQNPPAKEPAASSHRFESHLHRKHLNSLDYDTRQERDLEPNYELEDEQAEEDYERTRPQLSYGGPARLPVVLIIVAGVVATISWQWTAITEFYQLLSNIGSKSHSQASHETPSARSKFSGRVRMQQGDGQAPSAAAPGGQTEAAVAQRVVLYEEDPNDPQGKRYIGSAIWRTETVSPDTGIAPELAVRADVEIPERRMTVTWSMRRNTDKALPASYTIETMFNLPADFPGGGIANVPGILMKRAEQARGTELAGQAVKVTKGFFLIGLSAADADVHRNEQLLKDRSWFDIPIVYANGGRALLAMEKGPPGDRAFAEAFATWEKK